MDGTIGEGLVFLKHFDDLPDPREAGKAMYPLDEILLPCLPAVLAGAETFTEIARFGAKKLDLVRRFLPSQRHPGPRPSARHLRGARRASPPALFRRLGCGADRGCRRGDRHRRLPAGDAKRQDGAAVGRRKGQERRESGDPHGFGVRSEPAPRPRAGEGGFEIERNRRYPEASRDAGDRRRIVTIDAMGCQRDITKTIVDKKADSVLALRGNQGSLRDDVEVFVAEQKARDFRDTTISRHRTVDGDHGRIETRTTTVIQDVGWLQERHDWPRLGGIDIVDSRREIDGKIERKTRLHITSLPLLVAQLGPLVRSHRAVENSLHWVMDMIFRDDECRVRTDHAPATFTTTKHMALNLLRDAKSKDPLRLRRKVAGRDDYLASLIAA